VTNDDLYKKVAGSVARMGEAIAKAAAAAHAAEQAMRQGPSLAGYLAEMAARAEAAEVDGDKRVIVDSITPAYEREILESARAFETARAMFNRDDKQWDEAARAWSDADRTSPPLRLRGWKWRR